MKQKEKLNSTKNLKIGVIKDAFPYFSGSCNALHAIGYAFNASADGLQVSSGEYVYTYEEAMVVARYDGFFRFSDKVLTDVVSGETLSVEDLEPYCMVLNRYPAWVSETRNS